VDSVLLSKVRGRLEAPMAHKGLTMPWWAPFCMDGVSIVSLVAAVSQRSSPSPPPIVLVAGLIGLIPLLIWTFIARLLPDWLEAALVITAVTLLFSKPVAPDFAPVPMIVFAGELVVISSAPFALGFAGVCLAVLGTAQADHRLAGSLVYMVGILLGLTVGFMMRWYIRALDAERGKQDLAREQALLAERQHIAREVHDVVAHSLSITLLHLTGARRALQQDREIDEAVEALAEAERVGRAAMADIRRTVGLLAGTPAGIRPLPGIDDIAGLIERTRAAGLNVGYFSDGDLQEIGASEGLGLYRIAQESLANIIKHAPSARAQVKLHACDEGIRLVISNTLPAIAAGPGTSGTGLIGMSERAAQLGADLVAGPDGDLWVVDVTVPQAGSRRAHSCVVQAALAW
jgi:signal transduction histidine kinase